MASVTLRARGTADPDVAWERYAQPDLWPTWSPQISRVECTSERLSAAATGRVYGPLGVHVDFVVDAVDEASREWAWSVRFGRVRLHLAHGVTAHAGGSETWLRVRGPLPVILGYVPLAQLALRRLVR